MSGSARRPPCRKVVKLTLTQNSLYAAKAAATGALSAPFLGKGGLCSVTS